MLSVNEIDVDSLSLDEIIGLVRGPNGSYVILDLVTTRRDFAETKRVSLRRQLSSTFEPDMMSVSWQEKRHHPPRDVPHLPFLSDFMQRWGSSLTLRVAENCDGFEIEDHDREQAEVDDLYRSIQLRPKQYLVL